jgi:hypothetical protein
MMTDASLHRRSAHAQASWSSRVLLLSVAGIFFLTFYPFQFAHQKSAHFLFAFSLEGWGKGGNFLDLFLNVLLFIPFGFGLAESLRERGKSRLAAFFIVYVSGALLSYFVEFVQMFIPFRESGWGDIITNSSGAAIGAIIFELAGVATVEWFGRRERGMESWLSLPKIAVIASLYVGFWCVLARPLQKQNSLANWTQDAFLSLGDSASLHSAPPWKGRMLELDIWDHSVSAELARKITSQIPVGNQVTGALVAYNFSGSAPFQDDRRFSPNLDWASQAPASAINDDATFDGRSWLISAGPVPTLVRSIETTGQFAIHLVCQSAESAETDARIFSISSPSGAANLELSQSGSALAFWFRNRFSARRARMTWTVPQVFLPNQTRNLLLSFDGSSIRLFVNGQDFGHPYELGPSVALASYVRRVKNIELEGYRYIFYAIIFFPAGWLLGFTWRKSDRSWIGRGLFVIAGSLLPAMVLEWVLVDAAGRAASFQNVCFPALLAVAGSLWINADRSFFPVPSSQQEPIAVK